MKKIITIMSVIMYSSLSSGDVSQEYPVVDTLKQIYNNLFQDDVSQGDVSQEYLVLLPCLAIVGKRHTRIMALLKEGAFPFLETGEEWKVLVTLKKKH